METRPLFKVSSERLVEWRIKPANHVSSSSSSSDGSGGGDDDSSSSINASFLYMFQYFDL